MKVLRWIFCISMKLAALSILIVIVSFSSFAGEASRNFNLSKIFIEPTQELTGAGNPKITFNKKFIVSPGTSIGLYRVAFNTKASQFLFIWETNVTFLIKGKLLNAKGIPISGELDLGATYGFISVAYNPQNNEFLLVYDNNLGNLGNPTPNKSSIFLQRISDAGKRIGNALELTKSFPASSFSPKVVFNPLSGGYTLVWNRDDGMVGQLVSASGKPNGPVVMIHRTNALFFPPYDLIYQPSGDKLLVTYFVGNTQVNGDVYLGTLDPMLKNGKESNLKKINTAPVNRENAFWNVALAFLPDQTGVVFFADNDKVKRRPISAKGTLSGSSVPAFHDPKQGIRGLASAAFATNSKGTFGVLIGGDRSGTWTQILDSKGLAVGPPVLAPTAVVATILPAPVKPAETTFNFLYFGYGDIRTASGLLSVFLKLTTP
jgi:hypothetical protein